MDEEYVICECECGCKNVVNPIWRIPCCDICGINVHADDKSRP